MRGAIGWAYMTDWHFIDAFFLPFEVKHPVPVFRAGSYPVNMWLVGSYSDIIFNFPFKPDSYFVTESQIASPEKTPIVADSHRSFIFPKAKDPMLPSDRNPGWGITGIGAPRHGKNSGKRLDTWPMNEPLPGSVNVVFFDGHSSQVPLHSLWNLSWHRDYRAPGVLRHQ